MGRKAKHLELLSHQRREIAEAASKPNAARKRIAHEYGITLAMISHIVGKWKKYLRLRKYFQDLAGD
jgi:hypothetical protein